MWNFKRDIFRIAGETACVIPNMSGYSFAMTDEVCTSCTPQTRYNLEKYTKLRVNNYASFKPDGTQVYFTQHNNGLWSGPPYGILDPIIAYNLGTPWDVSTIIANGEITNGNGTFATPAYTSITTSYGSPNENKTSGHSFSPDGVHLFTCGSDLGLLQKYNLSTAWDITTANLNSSTTEYTGTTGTLSAVKFSVDGLTMILLGSITTAKYTLSSPWVITGGTSISTASGNYNDIDFQNNGLYLFTFDGGGANLVRKTLSSPYNITGITSTQILNLSGILLGPAPKICFKNGHKGFISYYNNPSVISAFELSCSFDISGPLI